MSHMHSDIKWILSLSFFSAEHKVLAVPDHQPNTQGRDRKHKAFSLHQQSNMLSKVQCSNNFNFTALQQKAQWRWCMPPDHAHVMVFIGIAKVTQLSSLIPYHHHHTMNILLKLLKKTKEISHHFLMHHTQEGFQKTCSFFLLQPYTGTRQSMRARKEESPTGR